MSDTNTADQLINWEEASQLTDGDDELLQITADAFAQSVQEDMLKLEKAIKEQNARELQRMAHSIKAGLRSLCAAEPANIAFNLELAGQNSEFSQVDEDFAALQNQIKQVLTDIVRWKMGSGHAK